MEALVVNPNESPPLTYAAAYPPPTLPPGEVLIRVHLAGICATDLELARGYLRFAGVPGHEFVGTVSAGPAELKDRRVVAEINCTCGTCDLCRRGLPAHCRQRSVLGIAGRNGAFATLTAVPARNCHLVPPEVSDEQAVFAEPLAAALQVLEIHPVRPDDRVAVLGSGRLGLLVAQVLALQGCRLHVVGRNPRTLGLCRKWGLHTLDVVEVSPRADYDVVVECTGSPEGLRLAIGMCRPRGTIVLKSTYAPSAGDAGLGSNLATVVVNELRIAGSRCGPFAPALQLLSEHKVHVDEMISGTYALRDGLRAFQAAADPDNLKILLRPDSP